jgi:hypothetical protein
MKNDNEDTEDNNNKRKDGRKDGGGPELQFPGRLHHMLEAVERQGWDSIISWTPDGTAIRISDPDQLAEILPRFFSLTKYRSFRRQLNMWHFERINENHFRHPLFLRDNKAMCASMSRNILNNQWKVQQQQQHQQHQQQQQQQQQQNPKSTELPQNEENDTTSEAFDVASSLQQSQWAVSQNVASSSPSQPSRQGEDNYTGTDIESCILRSELLVASTTRLLHQVDSMLQQSSTLESRLSYRDNFSTPFRDSEEKKLGGGDGGGGVDGSGKKNTPPWKTPR